MRRREFIGFIGSVAAAWSLDAHAQQPKRIGWLEQGQPGDPAAQARIAAVRQGLERWDGLSAATFKSITGGALSASKWRNASVKSC